MDLKENWKEHKNDFIRKKKPEEEKDIKQIDIERRRNQLRRQVADKLKIKGNRLTEFLTDKQEVQLEEEATSTSFSYFYSQAQACLQSFDMKEGKQTEFETRGEYNMFQWKAMRSLYREGILEVWGSGKRGCQEMKEYPLINLMYKKQQEGNKVQAQLSEAEQEGEARKIIKTD